MAAIDMCLLTACPLAVLGGGSSDGRDDSTTCSGGTDGSGSVPTSRGKARRVGRVRMKKEDLPHQL